MHNMGWSCQAFLTHSLVEYVIFNGMHSNQRTAKVERVAAAYKEFTNATPLDTTRLPGQYTWKIDQALPREAHFTVVQVAYLGPDGYSYPS
jgi:hypothetical protein